MNNGELSPREQELIQRFRDAGQEIFPGAEKYVLQQLRQERDATRQVILKPAHTFAPRETIWLWRDRIPIGELALIAGRGNVGKSTILAQMAAWITTGIMKGAYYGTPQRVIYVVNEDSIEQTVLPRMLAAGADTRLVHFLEVQTPQGQAALELPRDGERIRDAIDATRAVAVFVDPLSANVDGKANDQKEMRAAFQAVRRIAEDAQVSITGLAHVRKAQTTNMVEAIMGSAEQGNVARAVLGVVADPDVEGAYILSQEKNNLGPTGLNSFRYQLQTAYVADDIRTSRLEWLEETDVTASDVLADQAFGQGSTSEVVDWLRHFLETQGPTPRGEVITQGGKEGHSRAAIGRAKIKLKVQSARTSLQGGSATWSLPVPESTGFDHET